MTFDFPLFLRMAHRAFLRSAGTPARLTRQRFLFLVIFYLVWPIGSLCIWLGFLLDDILFPGYRKQPVERPLFILGNFRSGSTFLHRLLSRDRGNFTSLTTWDIYLAPSVTAKKLMQLIGRLDRLVGAPLRRLALAFDQRTLGRVQIHHISFFEPEEDENILMHTWSTYFITFLFPFLDSMPAYQYFDDALSEKEKLRIFAFYKSMLQRHLYATGARHFVSKSPAFCGKIETLSQIFPDARILYLIRTPLDMLPSTISWINYARRYFADPGPGYHYLDEIVQMTQYWYRHPLAFLDANPSNRHRIVQYDDLIEDPEGVVRSFYAQFDYPPPEALSAMVQRAVVDTRATRSVHSYSYEAMGFTRPQIEDLYADIFARFNFRHGRHHIDTAAGRDTELELDAAAAAADLPALE